MTECTFNLIALFVSGVLVVLLLTNPLRRSGDLFIGVRFAAIVCAIVIFFPAISLSDDLAAGQVFNECCCRRSEEIMNPSLRVDVSHAGAGQHTRNLTPSKWEFFGFQAASDFGFPTSTRIIATLFSHAPPVCPVA